jgi:Big-like domain-containing protein
MAPLHVLASPPNAGSTLTFAYTGSEQSFVVPTGATMMQVTVVGAAGGNTSYAGGSSENNAARGGSGAAVSADIAAPGAGSTVYVEVGGTETVGGNATGVGGFNGGGNGGPGSGGGGGASDLRTIASSAGASSLASRLVVAAGGGGAGYGGADVNSFCYDYGCPPGHGGSAQSGTSTGAAGQTAPNIDGTADYHYGGYPFVQGGNGGGGATSTAFGAGGTSPAPAPDCSYTVGGCTGSPGAAGSSGQGGGGNTSEAAGGGGGGGYFGGGGGASGVGYTTYALGGGGGGGAGSSFVEAGSLNPVFGVATGGAEVVVTFNPTTVAATCTANPDPVNVGTTCTATVSNVDSGDAVPATGSVTWSDAQNGSTLPTSCTLGGTASCSVTFTPAAGSEGAHSLTASYSGDSAHSASATTTSVTASKRSDTTGVVCAPLPVVVGQTTSCTATVSDTGAGTAITPGGTMTWSSAAGTFSPPTCPLAADACSSTFTPSAGSVGSATVGATYGGDTDHLTSSGSTPVTVDQRSDSISADCGPGTVTVNVPVSCTIHVADTASGVKVGPTGAATWAIALGQGSIGGSCLLTTSGSTGACQVSFTATSGSEGLIQIKVTYSGDVNFPGGGLTISLTGEQRQDSTHTVCGPLEAGIATTCTATVTDTDGGTPITPTGTVDFSVGAGSGTFGDPSCTLDNSGACSVTYTPTVAGVRTMLVSYGGDTDHVASSGDIQISSALRNVTLTINCASPMVAIGPTDACTVTVADSDPGQATIPTGTVSWSAAAGPDTFSSGGTCALDGTGACTIEFSADPGSTGTQALTAQYSGDSVHATSSLGTTLDVVPQLPITDALVGSTPANHAITLTPTTPTGVGPFTYSLVTTPPAADGGVAIDATTGAVTFTPAANFSGVVPAFLYAITDQYGQQAQQDVSITVDPIAMDDAAAGTAGSTITVTPPPPTGTAPFRYAFVGSSIPSGDGTFSIDATTGVISFTPTAAFAGQVSVEYTVTDATGATSAPAIVSFDVRALAVTVPETGASPGVLASGLALLLLGLFVVGQALWFRPRRLLARE